MHIRWTIQTFFSSCNGQPYGNTPSYISRSQNLQAFGSQLFLSHDVEVPRNAWFSPNNPVTLDDWERTVPTIVRILWQCRSSGVVSLTDIKTTLKEQNVHFRLHTTPWRTRCTFQTTYLLWHSIETIKNEPISHTPICTIHPNTRGK